MKPIKLIVCVLLLPMLGISTTAGAPFVPARDAHCVAFSFDGRLVAIGMSGQSNEGFPPGPHPNPRKCGVVQWFDADTGRRVHRKETFGDLTRIAFSRDAKLIAAARLYTTPDRVGLNEVHLWHVDSGRTALVFDRCHAFAFSPLRDEIVLVSRRRCVVYDLNSGEKLRQFSELGGAVSINWSVDGERLTAVVHGAEGTRIRVTAAESGEMLAESAPLDQPFYTAAVAPDGSRIATGHPEGNVLLWDGQTAQLLGRLNSGGKGRQHPFFSPDGGLLGSGDQQNSDVVFWDVNSGEELRRYTFKQGEFHTYHIRSDEDALAPEKDPARFTFSPDGQSFLSGPYGGIIRLISSGRDTMRFGD